MKISRRLALSTTAAVPIFAAGCLGDTEYQLEELSVNGAEGPLTLKAELSDPVVEVGSPGSISLKIRNDAETSVTLFSRGIGVFGLLRATPPGAEGGILLYNPVYESSRHMRMDSKHSFQVSGDQIATRVDPGQSTSREYEIHGELVYTEGPHEVVGWRDTPFVQYRFHYSEEMRELPPCISFKISSQSLLPDWS